MQDENLDGKIDEAQVEKDKEEYSVEEENPDNAIEVQVIMANESDTVKEELSTESVITTEGGNSVC